MCVTILLLDAKGDVSAGMTDSILEILAKRAPRRIKDEDASLNREIKRLVSRIKTRVGKSKGIRSARGGLQSMGARGVVVKENDIFSRRVVVKASYIRSSDKNSRARVRHHLNYAGQDKLDELKNAPELYDANDRPINLKEKVDGLEDAPHMFNIIISPEDGDELDLKKFTREFIQVIEKDLKTKLEWVAGNHYDTNDPHVHVLIKGKDEDGNRLLMKRDYISHGLRARAGQVATRNLGLRSYEDIVKSIELRIASTKKCELDDIILAKSNDGKFNLAKTHADDFNDLPISLFRRRLEFLESKGLVQRADECSWNVKPSLREDLQSLDRTHSLISKMSDGLKVDKETCEIVSAKNATNRIIKGHVVERGHVDERDAKEYLLIKSKEKKFIYVELEKYSEKAPAQVGEFVRIETTRPFSGPLNTDKTIEKFAESNSGIYDAAQHAKQVSTNKALPPGVSATEYAQIHVNRLELLARKGLVEKLSEGKFKISHDHVEKISFEARKSQESYQPHIKIIRLSPARLKSNGITRGLSR